MKTCKFLSEECRVDISNKYESGMTAIQLITLNNEPMCTATTNIPEVWAKYNSDKEVVLIKNYTENTGVAEALIEANIIEEIERIGIGQWMAEVVVARILK